MRAELIQLGLFQSTHPRGVRHHGFVTQTVTGSFNPRTHVGCDRLWRTQTGMTVCFNPRTHVGCDATPIAPNRVTTGFQSTHPRGVRPVTPSDIARLTEFQSTHPRGVRRNRLRSPYPRKSFNPRTHVGCDHIDFCGHGFDVVSIHAPTWGATRCRHFDEAEAKFQSTHPRGVRLTSTMRFMTELWFQSTHPRGVRLNECIRNA